MIATLTIAALGLAVADDQADDRDEPTIEERFRVLYALDKEAAYALLISDKSKEEIVGLLNSIAQWATKAKNLDDLAARILEYDIVNRLYEEDPEAPFHSEVLTAKVTLSFTGDTAEEGEIIAQVPVFAATPSGVLQYIRAYPGAHEVVSWDKDRILVMFSNDSDDLTRWVAKFVPMNKAAFCGHRLYRTPLFRDPS